MPVEYCCAHFAYVRHRFPCSFPAPSLACHVRTRATGPPPKPRPRTYRISVCDIFPLLMALCRSDDASIDLAFVPPGSVDPTLQCHPCHRRWSEHALGADLGQTASPHRSIHSGRAFWCSFYKHKGNVSALTMRYYISLVSPSRHLSSLCRMAHTRIRCYAFVPSRGSESSL
jgi:hypothetical protein